MPSKIRTKLHNAKKGYKKLIQHAARATLHAKHVPRVLSTKNLSEIMFVRPEPLNRRTICRAELPELNILT